VEDRVVRLPERDAREREETAEEGEKDRRGVTPREGRARRLSEEKTPGAPGRGGHKDAARIAS